MSDLLTIRTLNEFSAATLPTLVDATLLGSLLLATVAIVFRMTRTATASTRHFGLLLAVAAPALLPALAALLPQWHVLPNGRLSEVLADQLSFDMLTAHDLSIGHDVPSEPDVPAENTVLVAAGVPSDKAIDVSPQEAANPFWLGENITIASVLCIVWGFGVVTALSVWGFGVVSLWRLGHRSTSIRDRRLDHALQVAISRIGTRRGLRLLSSDCRSMPMQWGTLRPTILLPTEATRWDRSTIEAVLLHELAHVRRHDHLTHSIALLTRSFFWFNPLTWWAVHRLRCECESACDDLLLNSGTNPFDYADALLFVTRSARDSQCRPSAAMGMSSVSELEWRIRGILNQKRHRDGMTRRTAVLLIIGFSCILWSAAVLRSQADEAPRSLASAPSTDVPNSVVRLSHSDDSAEGRRSIAGSGHAVRFTRPESANRVAAIELFASRYGTHDPPNEDFHLYILDDMKRLIAAHPIAYSQIVRGPERWYTLPIKACQVPKHFYVAVAFNPHRTKGIYLGYDQHSQPSHSLTGRPTTDFQRVEQTGDWMIRAVMTHRRKPTNPFESPAT